MYIQVSMKYKPSLTPLAPPNQNFLPQYYLRNLQRVRIAHLLRIQHGTLSHLPSPLSGPHSPYSPKSPHLRIRASGTPFPRPVFPQAPCVPVIPARDPRHRGRLQLSLGSPQARARILSWPEQKSCCGALPPRRAGK